MTSFQPFVSLRASEVMLVMVPASLLALMALKSDRLTGILEVTQGYIRTGTLKKLLALPIGLTMIKMANQFANTFALNNWRLSGTKNWNWSSESAVVTGGCSGIGRSIAIGLASRGLKVAILDVADFPRDLGELDNISYWKCDISSASEVAKVAAEIRETLGDPCVLVNNAGITAYGLSILETPTEKVQNIFDVNIVSQWSTIQQFLPAMVSRNKGHIVTISSMAGYVTSGRSVSYAATKAGLVALHQGLQAEIKNVYKAPGVMTTIVHPMWVETAMTKVRASESDAKRKSMMQPNEVADRVLLQVFSGRGGQLVLPDGMKWLIGIQSFPNWLQELIRDFAVRTR